MEMLTEVGACIGVPSIAFFPEMAVSLTSLFEESSPTLDIALTLRLFSILEQLFAFLWQQIECCPQPFESGLE